jgi:hypothetical protein
MARIEPKTIEGIQAELPQLHDAICAMQSLDDLGDDEANNQADRDMRALLVRYERLEAKLKEALS